MRKKIIKLFLGAALMIGIVASYSLCNVQAASFVESVYTNNCPGIQDWRHDFYKTDTLHTYMSRNITGWVKKDSYNDIILNYTESVSGTIGYSVTSSASSEIGGDLMGAAVKGSRTVSATLSYSYTKTTMSAYTWTINKNEPGMFFCLAVNYKTRQYDIKHYKQKFKWFGQGEYVYKSTSSIDAPTEKYLAKNYRYEIDGVIYER